MSVEMRPRRRTLFLQGLVHVWLCLQLTTILASHSSLFSFNVPTPAVVEREDLWRFEAVPLSDAALLAWGIRQQV
jgi:hypothetical protein